MDLITLAQAMIRCPSVTPADAGALDILEAALAKLGFRCHRLKFSAPGTADVDNLYARFGVEAPNFCFAGHTDVVPPGERSHWSVDPFAGIVSDGYLIGRGAADMKGAIAAFVTATERLLENFGRSFSGSISLLITGDEEGPAVNGTTKVLDWMKERGEIIDACIVGEPTNPTYLGEMVKIGRRGSLTGRLKVYGAQGHIAYPHLADNPIPRLIKAVTAITASRLDDGNDQFQPSNLEVTTIDVGNSATNVIPAEAKATFNIRYNTIQTGARLEAWLREVIAKEAGAHALDIEHGAQPFLTPQGHLSEVVSVSIQDVLGLNPEFSTTGGTSDARFIQAYCPVVEFGLVGQTMHKIDECVRVQDLMQLSDIYFAILKRWFKFL